MNGLHEYLTRLTAYGEVRIRLHRGKWIVLVDGSNDYPLGVGEAPNLMEAFEKTLRQIREG